MDIVPISFPAGENLYMLWNQLRKDDFETDVIEILREYSMKAESALKGYERTAFSEIYMFFDYDGHNNNLPSGENVDDALQQMLETFDDETNLGKLYINYPMVEALRDNYPIGKEKCYRRCWIKISEIKHYKHTVNEVKYYQDFRNISEDGWGHLCTNAVRKLNCIIKQRYEVPERNEFINELTQKVLFEKKDLYAKNDKIAIISCFPIFLLEYFKEEFGIAY